MQKYTGNEAFYNIEDWEKSHPLSQEFASTKIAEKYIKSICKKLFSKKGGKYAEPDFFDEKFRVIVCDKDVPNAFHRHEIYNYNGCSCLAVTKELINFCQNITLLSFHIINYISIYIFTINVHFCKFQPILSISLNIFSTINIWLISFLLPSLNKEASFTRQLYPTSRPQRPR